MPEEWWLGKAAPLLSVCVRACTKFEVSLALFVLFRDNLGLLVF